MNAADLSMPFKAPPPAPAFSWTGFYIGAEVGYAWGKDTTTEYLTAANTFTGFNPSYNVHSAVGRLYGGYNYQIGSAVLGIESDIEAANINGGFTAPAVGFTADKVLFYGTGGLAFADISHTLHQFDHRGSRSHRKSPYRLDRWRRR